MLYFKTIRHKRTIGLFLCSLVIFFCFSSSVFAQILPTSAAPQTEVSIPPKDALGRETPKGMIQEFLKTVGSENYEQAALYLDLSKYSKSWRKKKGPELAKSLQTLLDQGGWVTALSDSPEGKQDDGLPPDIELVGTIQAGGESFSLLIERSSKTKDVPIWLISRETVSTIPDMLETMSVGFLDSILPKVLIENKWSGVPIGHWAALVVLAGFAVIASWLLTSGIIFLIRFAWESTYPKHMKRILGIFILPLRVYIVVVVFAILTRVSGVSIVARQDLGLIAGIITWLALAWLLWRVIDVIALSTQERMTHKKRQGGLSVIAFFRRSVKFFLAAIAIAVVLDRLGINVTAGVAALGVGGLVLALGAQKTIENFVNSLTLIIEQPVRLGDFCKVGDIVGTVEDIGMRSTRLKTLDRTVVTIPNGMFASLMIENYTLRKRFWFHPTIGLRYETTPEQIRYLLVKIRELLYSHPRIDPSSIRVRFTKFGASSLDIETFAYVRAENYNRFLEIKEDLMLNIMEIVDESGSGFAFPSQTLYMAKDTGLSEEKQRNAEAYVQKWREKGDLPLPDFKSKRNN
ncbi:MAG: mechanosensitive ion channel [Alphaproteobacteria bacterium]|nr:mechanosensitive ion channel [Alphaproteobacteria bacterium]